MDVIVTHISADFDALASLIAAKKLYPQAQIVVPGSAEEVVRKFMLKFEKKLGLQSERKVDLDKISRLIIVDTRHARRIGKIEEVLGRKNIEIHIYDHHPEHPEDIKGKINIGRITGATVTILSEIIQKKKIDLSHFEATLMLLGLYQDTGSLTYPSTTEEDKDAAEFLISRGADLKLISNYLKKKLRKEQILLYKKLKKNKEDFFFSAAKVIILTSKVRRYIPDLAFLTQRLMNEEKADIAFSLVEMKRHLHLVARSNNNKLNVEKIVNHFGGGGHPTAAYAQIRGVSLPSAKKALLQVLKEKIKKPKPDDWTKNLPRVERLLSVKISAQKEDLTDLLKTKLPQRILKFLKEIGRVGTKKGIKTFVVGGFVRDIILGVPNYDLDIVVEGDGIAFADDLAGKWKGKVRKHKKFGTAVVYLSNGFKIDVASARTEYYHYPAALPQVKSSSLKADLYRRDFTINAMAVCLNKAKFGDLVDFFGGKKDIKKGIIRSLHNLSFVDDPTRIFRAVRFEQRYGFKISSHTQHLIRTAVNLDMFDWLTNQRVLSELILILSEKKPIPAIKRMAEFNEQRFIHPRIKLNRNGELLLERVNNAILWFKNEFLKEKIENWSVYFLALLDNLNEGEVEQVIQKFVFSQKNKNRFIMSKKSCPRVLNNLRKSKLKNSEIFYELMGFSLETLLFLSAKAGVNPGGKRIRFFITNLRKVRPLIKGKDLAILGFKEGPVYKEIFKDVLWNKLDGKLATKREELAYVQERWIKKR